MIRAKRLTPRRIHAGLFLNPLFMWRLRIAHQFIDDADDEQRHQQQPVVDRVNPSFCPPPGC